MAEYIPIICFVAGLAVGIAITIIGFRLGWRASYEIRSNREEGPTENKGLFKSKTDPAEFELLEKEEKENGV